MKTNIVAVIGGITILIGGLALAFYTGTNGQELVKARAKAIDKYIAMSEKALQTGDIKNAKKYAKEALVIDPKNSKAFKELEKVILASCPKTQVASTPTKTEAKAPAPAPEAEDDDEMGCI